MSPHGIKLSSTAYMYFRAAALFDSFFANFITCNLKAISKLRFLPAVLSSHHAKYVLVGGKRNNECGVYLRVAFICIIMSFREASV